MTTNAPALPDQFADLDIAALAVLGSTAYGLAHADSDIDRVGIFVAPLREVLGLGGAAAVTRSVVTHEPDVTVHEVGKFVSLALKANPTILEVLYVQQYDVLSAVGRALVEHRSDFLSASAVRAAFGGYATAQARKLASREPGDERIAKAARHAVRLLRQGEQLLTTGTMTLDVSHHRDELFAIGAAAVQDPRAFAADFDERIRAFDNATTVLPDWPATRSIDQLLVDIRTGAVAG